MNPYCCVLLSRVMIVAGQGDHLQPRKEENKLKGKEEECIRKEEEVY